MQQRLILFLYVPIFVSDAQIQLVFNHSIRKKTTFSFDSWSTDGKTVEAQLEYQVDIGPAQNTNSPKFLIVGQQPAARIGVPNKAKNITVSDNLNVRK